MLDQNFPLSPAGMRFEYLDRSVTLTHFNAAFLAYARVSTADWKMYLLAKSAGFDAVVTSDHNQLDEDTEMVVLQLAKLGLITWRKGEPDTVVLYGQLLAYLPGIVRELRRQPASVFVLPSASLRRTTTFAAHATLREKGNTEMASATPSVVLPRCALSSVNFKTPPMLTS